MKLTLTLLTVLLLTTVSFAQPASPGISQVLAFFCNQNFTQCPNGFDPTLPPVQLSDGNLYVVTWWAGQGNPNAGGTVFRAAPSGQGFVIHTFQPGFPQRRFPERRASGDLLHSGYRREPLWCHGTRRRS